MDNAHLRMGTLCLVRQTANTVTNVTVHLNQLIAEPAESSGSSASLHLLSMFGGDSEIGAMATAANEGLRFQVNAAGVTLSGTIGEKPVLYKASLQVPGRRRPVRHLIVLSKFFSDTTLGANSEARRTVLYDDSPDFVLHRLAVRFGVPVLPEWAKWFHAELYRRTMVQELIGINCSPIAVTGNKVRMLRILSQGLKRGVIRISEEPSLFASSGVDADPTVEPLSYASASSR